MSIEQADIIDEIGVRPDGAVEMLISDHLEWDGPAPSAIGGEGRGLRQLGFVGLTPAKLSSGRG
jgi:hypothetical protein